MARAHREVPPVTWVEECDFEGVPLDRLLATVVKACADSLAEFPELNARLDGDAIVYLDRYDIGVAVQTDDGLVVPVVRAANEKSVDELGAEIAGLAEHARAGSLAADDLRGSTFTVSSAGKLAGLFQTPIVNHPEVAILSIGRVAPRAVVRDGEVVVRPTGTLAITFDHRVVDGARAAAFGLAVIARIEGAGGLRRRASAPRTQEGRRRRVPPGGRGSSRGGLVAESELPCAGLHARLAAPREGSTARPSYPRWSRCDRGPQAELPAERTVAHALSLQAASRRTSRTSPGAHPARRRWRRTGGSCDCRCTGPRPGQRGGGPGVRRVAEAAITATLRWPSRIVGRPRGAP